MAVPPAQVKIVAFCSLTMANLLVNRELRGKTMIEKIDHINIVVSNLEESQGFFERLGFERRDGKALSGPLIETVTGLGGVEARFVALGLPGQLSNSGETIIELIEYRSPAGKADPKMSAANQLGLRHIAFRVRDIDAWFERLSAANVPFVSPVQINRAYHDKKMCYFHGPDGILLELMEYST